MNRTNPLVSVIVPVYNREDTVGAALQSVLQQTFGDFELIVVDDGSTDGSLEVIGRMRDLRIRVFEQGQNLGACAARNRGIRLARGEYIAFQDSDDLWEPQKLEKQMELFARLSDEYGVVYSAFWRFREGRREYIPGKEFAHKQKDGAIVESLLLKNFITPQAVVVRKQCFDKVGLFNEKLDRFQDWEIWLRIARHYYFAFVDQPLVKVYFSEKSISASQADLIDALSFIFETHYDLYAGAGKNYLAGMIFSCGHNLCLGGEMKQGRRQVAQALQRDPFRGRYWLSYLCGWMGKDMYKKIYSLLCN